MITFTRCAFMAKQACATCSKVVQKIPPVANNFLKFFFALFAILTLNAATAWAEEVTYVFTSKDWKAKIGSTTANWTSNKAGAEFSNNGIQVTTNATGANGTSPISYNNISQIVVTYNTNKNKGNGTLSVKIGDNAVTTNNWKYSGNADGTSANFTSTFDYSSPQSGKVTLTANTTTNSIYVVSIKIVTSAGSEPTTPTQLAAPTGLTVDAITSSGATLSWNAVDNASSYVVTIVDGGSFEKVYPVTGTITTVSDLDSSTDYLWTVTAVGDETNYTNSEESETGEFTTSAPAGGDEEPGSGTSGGDKYTKVTTLDDLEDGAYYVLYGVSGSYTGALKNTVSSGKAGLQAVTITEDAITNPDAAIVWRLNGNSSDGWTLYNEKESKYIEIKTNSTSGFSLNESSSHTYTVTVSSEKGFFFKSNHTDANSRGISIYRTDFRPYASNSANILYLFKKATETGGDEPGTEEPTWTISKDAIDFADKYVGVSYTETFTISASNLNGDITLAVTGNYFDVTPETIASNVSFPQTVTVTYKPEEAGNHTAILKITSTEVGDKTISLKGSAKEAKIYTKTDLANITKYDEVLIVGTNANGSFAMANNEATNSGPKAISVIVDDNTIATDNTNIQWRVGNTDGELIFAPKDAEKWLYCNNDNNGLRIGSVAESMTFEIKDDYIFNTVQSRYIGIYNSQEWRSYTLTNGGEFPTNIKDQTFAFYIIKGEVPDNVFSITYNTNGGNAINPATDLTTIPSTLPTPTKEGYNFAGWYTDNAFTAPAIAGTPLTDNITLYAKWADPYTVAYARTLIAADSESAGVYAYVVGVVTAVEEISTEYGNATYSIGDTEDATEILKVYRGNYLANEKFTAADQLKKGDQVVVYGKMINHTTGGYQFAQGNYIYKLTSAAGKETTTLSWSATTCKVQIGATNTFPTLTKSHDLTTIKYTSSNTSVATIANDGTITLVAAGTTTITAEIKEDATYAASSASYELTVVEVVSTGIFQLYSGELAEGEYVLVDGTNDKALKAAVAGDTRLAGEDVTIADNAILNPDASIVWNLAKSGTDWTIYNEYQGKYVAGTGVKNAAQLLTDGTDEKALWTVTVTETYDIVNKFNEEAGVNSHLRWGGTYWACYGSTTGKALRLYKKIDVPTPTISLASGTYIGTQTATVSCALATATIYYTINGDTPTTSSASVAVGGSINIPTTCTLKAIAVEGTKKSEVVQATYTLVTDGVWTLVRDADELQDGDLVVMASNANGVVNGANAKSEYFTTASVTFTDDKDKAAIIDFSNDALIFTLKEVTNGKWLLASGNNYVDLHGDKQNALVEESSTTWTISVNEKFEATIANGGSMFRYNSSAPRFKTYTSSTGTLPQLYKLVTTYTRTVNAGEYGTICLPGQANRMSGAIFYELAGRDTKFAYLDEVTELEAGTPYIFYATSNTLTVTYNGTKADDAKENVNGMYGTFTKIRDTEPAGSAKNILEGNYVVYNNELLLCGTDCGLYEYRAYVNVDEISTNVPAAVPGRRRVSMGVQGENTTTDFENITNGENNTIKVIENGQLFIIRNGEKYNIQGQKL